MIRLRIREFSLDVIKPDCVSLSFRGRSDSSLTLAARPTESTALQASLKDRLPNRASGRGNSCGAPNTAGKTRRPLQHNSQPCSGITIRMPWASATEQGFAAPMWITFKQGRELKAHVVFRCVPTCR
jgi:hypothetical protein